MNDTWVDEDMKTAVEAGMKASVKARIMHHDGLCYERWCGCLSEGCCDGCKMAGLMILRLVWILV